MHLDRKLRACLHVKWPGPVSEMLLSFDLSVKKFLVKSWTKEGKRFYKEGKSNLQWSLRLILKCWLRWKLSVANYGLQWRQPKMAALNHWITLYILTFTFTTCIYSFSWRFHPKRFTIATVCQRSQASGATSLSLDIFLKYIYTAPEV